MFQLILSELSLFIISISNVTTATTGSEINDRIIISVTKNLLESK